MIGICESPNFTSETDNEYRSFMAILRDCGLCESQVRNLSPKITEAFSNGFSYGKILSEFGRISHKTNIHHQQLSTEQRQDLYK